jgi:hypothetical protein
VTDEDTLAHYGTPRHSGRYPWGSGDDPYQDGLHFMSAVDELKKKGLTEAQIAKGLGFESSADYRARLSISSNDVRAEKTRQLTKLLDKGMSMNAATKQMGIPESSGRALMDPVVQARANRLRVTADILKENVDKHKYVDVGKGTENHMGISDTQLKTAIAMLKDEGYILQYPHVTQVGTGKDTSLKVLTHKDTPFTEVNNNKEKIHIITDHVDADSGARVELKPPVNIDSKRVGVIYGPDGGADSDGVIYLRPGVPDISLGNAQYAQVRIAVDGSHYIKGMAHYKDDLPAGVDVMFNTNKKDTGNKLDALKEQKEDPLNPFGSMTRQKTYTDPKSGEEKQSVLNIVNEEGDWYNWSNKFSSQFLSKQTAPLAKEQLQATQNAKKADLEDILALTNPGVKKKLLETFADEADSSAVKLKAAGLPRTATHVILPINSLKDTEIYAPKYNNGETVVLVRHPHGGIFEIPQLTVNNTNKEAARTIKGAKDAVGINAKVASRLSGADFDGDTVLVIPNNSGKVKTSAPLRDLKDFDPKEAYGLPKDSTKGLKGVKNPGAMKQRLMGDVSNLITDMTVKGAHQNEIARAVRHSMVVIDAEKHNLDYKQSAIDNGITELKRKYQGGARNGASTLISRTTSEETIKKRKARPASEGGPVDASTGEKKYVESGESYVNKQGETVFKTEKIQKGAHTNDAHSLVSENGGTVIERIYADHANSLKALANKARKESIATKNIPYSPSAKAAYAKEVKSLNAKLNIALKNAPLERQAQSLAQSIVKAKVSANPDLDKAELKKISGMALTEARARVGATKKKIQITDDEWAAIQSGAITASKLKQIIDNTDVDQLRERATPRDRPKINASNLALAQSMLASGNFTVAEIASRLGVSTSTLYTALEK